MDTPQKPKIKSNQKAKKMKLKILIFFLLISLAPRTYSASTETTPEKDLTITTTMQLTNLLGGTILFILGFYLIYVLYFKTKRWDQGQYYLKDPKEKYYCEYMGTVINLGKHRIMRFKMPEAPKKLLGADLEKIEL